MIIFAVRFRDSFVSSLFYNAITLYRSCWEFKLHGSPWTGISSDEGIRVRSLLAHILQVRHTYIPNPLPRSEHCLNYSFLYGFTLSGDVLILIPHPLQKLSFKGWHVMTSFDVCSKINKSDDRHPQPLDAQSWYLCKKEALELAFNKWKSKAKITDRPKAAEVAPRSPNFLADCQAATLVALSENAGKSKGQCHGSGCGVFVWDTFVNFFYFSPVITVAVNS